ncbi:putative transcriptional regulator [Desulforapulum autotrophicum HRM2]|uniref:Transcriptional regulator n=1 Tax=Desulforapulum autotrophicum (strain ATCC 43914 / DSM 3382 / VKM B-1955 / HRM2) TaxID=177437 RepID=C0QKH7_DESAH|nr:HTH domain-containing protein [Desulforapulum autotrophicum]ACN14048.1 putative transcriptional regulator [Desulforapulum autotrophicum HRM2]
MTVELKTGSLKNFFASAKETAKEIDEGQRLTPKKSIWVEPSDLMLILKPERTKLVQYLRKNRTVIYSELMSAMNRTPVSLNNDLKILSKYQLIKILKKPNPGHGMHKIIETTFGNEKIEFKAII